jgi:hypothetical protein
LVIVSSCAALTLLLVATLVFRRVERNFADVV